MTTTRFRIRGADGTRLSITRRQREAMTETAADAVNTEARVTNVILTYLDVDREKVTPEAKFIEDLGADSLDYIELTMGCEEEFDIEIGDDALDGVKTVGDLVKLIDKLVAA